MCHTDFSFLRPFRHDKNEDVEWREVRGEPSIAASFSSAITAGKGYSLSDISVVARRIFKISALLQFWPMKARRSLILYCGMALMLILLTTVRIEDIEIQE